MARHDACRPRPHTSRACGASRSTSGPATCSRSVLSQTGRPAHVRFGRGPLPRAAAHQPLAVPLSPRARRPALVGSSPETLVKLEGTRASLNPIAGTTAPGDGDAGAAARLREGPGRARDARRPGPKRPLARLRPRERSVESFLKAERYSHVTHLVSEVAGELEPGRTGFDLLRACFPAGTVSGAPKVRAMQISGRARGLQTRALRRGGRLRPPRWRARHLHRDPDDRPGRRGRASPGRRGHRHRLRPRSRAQRVPLEARRTRGRDRGGRTTT